MRFNNKLRLEIIFEYKIEIPGKGHHDQSTGFYSEKS